MSDIAKRFARETANHRMTVLHDDGLYRHLRFQEHVWRPPLAEPQPTSFYWFELITVPGSLTFRGDGESFVFARLTDMFEFFRGPVGQTNPHYWSEKLTSGHGDRARHYDRDLFKRRVREAFVDEFRGRSAPHELRVALCRDVLSPDEAWSEESAHRALAEFSYYADEKDRYGRHEYIDGKYTWIPAKRPDFEFSDTWEWDFRDYDWWFLWSLHAIVWGIAQYDAWKAPLPEELFA
jgi:hypothetical protein